MRGRGQSIFKIVGAIIQSKICYLLLAKQNTTSFLKLRYS